MKIDLYAVGLCQASACAPSEATAADVERAVNGKHPTGLSHGWHISDENFRTGESNPCECNSDSGRRHWLLVC